MGTVENWEEHVLLSRAAAMSIDPRARDGVSWQDLALSPTFFPGVPLTCDLWASGLCWLGADRPPDCWDSWLVL